MRNTSITTIKNETGMYCFVPECRNNSFVNSEKTFFRVPQAPALREKWCNSVGMLPSTLQKGKTMHCCSDHFNMERDVKPHTKDTEAPRLKANVVPSILNHYNSSQNETSDLIEDIFGADVSEVAEVEEHHKGSYVREVVYIEENDSEQFLQENMEESDCLSFSQDDSPTNDNAKAVVEISDDENLLKAVASAVKSIKSAESTLKAITKRKSVYESQFVQKVAESQPPTKYRAILETPELKIPQPVQKKNGKSTVLKSKSFTKSAATNQSSEVSHPKPLGLKSEYIDKLKMLTSKHPIQVKAQVPGLSESRRLLPNDKAQQTKVAVSPGSNAKQNKPTSGIDGLIRLPFPKPTTMKVIRKLSATQPSAIVALKQIPRKVIVNKSKYTSIKGAWNTTIQPVKNPDSPDDDDCILLDEEDPLPKARSNVSNVAPTNISAQASSTSASSPKDKNLARLPTCVSVKKNAVPDVSTVAEVTPKSVTVVSPTAKHTPKTKVTQHHPPPQHIQLIQLMLLENPSIGAGDSKGKRVTVTKLKKNEFRISDDVYYYRTNEEENHGKSYFFLNITENSRNFRETIRRNYGIYWGEPRMSCVGIVETKGVLDDSTKDFVFQQVKKSLLKRNNQRIVQMGNETSEEPLVPAILPPSSTELCNLNSNDSPTIINLDEDSDECTDESSVKNLMKFVHTFNLPNSALTETSLKQGQILCHPKDNNQTAPQSSSRVDETSDAIGFTVQRPQTKVNEVLAKFYRRLTASTQNLINKMRYFEMKGGDVYTVTIGPNLSSPTNFENPFNIVFLKNGPESTNKPVSRYLAISKLVNEIFEAIQANNGSKNNNVLILSKRCNVKTNSNNSLTSINNAVATASAAQTKNVFPVENSVTSIKNAKFPKNDKMTTEPITTAASNPPKRRRRRAKPKAITALPNIVPTVESPLAPGMFAVPSTKMQTAPKPVSIAAVPNIALSMENSFAPSMFAMPSTNIITPPTPLAITAFPNIPQNPFAPNMFGMPPTNILKAPIPAAITAFPNILQNPFAPSMFGMPSTNILTAPTPVAITALPNIPLPMENPFAPNMFGMPSTNILTAPAPVAVTALPNIVPPVENSIVPDMNVASQKKLSMNIVDNAMENPKAVKVKKVVSKKNGVNQPNVSNTKTEKKKSTSKNKCELCSLEFERSYQLKRHQFVDHHIDKVGGAPVSIISNPNVDQNAITMDAVEPESNLISGIAIKDEPQWHISAYNPELVTSDVEANTVPWNVSPNDVSSNYSEFNTGYKEEPLDDHMPDDKTLLVPLYEVLLEERKKEIENRSDTFLPMNIKEEPLEIEEPEEPEEHFENMLVMPLPTVQDPGTNKKPRKNQQQSKFCGPFLGNDLEETDSETETLTQPRKELKHKHHLKRVKLQKIKLKKIKLKAKEGKKTKMTFKLPQKVYMKHKTKLKNLPNKQTDQKDGLEETVKISEAKRIMKNWPRLTVNLTDVVNII